MQSVSEPESSKSASTEVDVEKNSNIQRLLGACQQDYARAVGQSPDIREPMLVFPGLFQPLLTSITGKPYKGQTPKWRPSVWWPLSTGLTRLLIGVLFSAILLLAPSIWWPFFVITWLVTASGARQLQSHMLHQLVHGTFIVYGPAQKAAQKRLPIELQEQNKRKNSKLSHMIGEILSILLCIQSFDAYKQDHVGNHHSKMLATLDDIDVKFLLKLGFRPGMTREALWRHLWRSLVSPRFHSLFLLARFKANFVNSPWNRKVVTIAFHITILTTVALTHTWLIWLMAWIIPVVLLYQCSALLHWCSEHHWLQIPDPSMPGKIILARLTNGRFCGEATPNPALHWRKRMLVWGRWWFCMFFLHIPARLFVLNGDNVVHDFHHRHPSPKDMTIWTQAVYARQQDIEAGCPDFYNEPYVDIWGLGHAIDVVFTGLSKLTPLPPTVPPLTLVEVSEVMNGM